MQLDNHSGVAKSKFTQDEGLFLELLKELRLRRNLTQTQLADCLGFPQSYVSKYETGERRLDFVETANVCEALGISILEFCKTFIDRSQKEAGRKKLKS